MHGESIPVAPRPCSRRIEVVFEAWRALDYLAKRSGLRKGLHHKLQHQAPRCDMQ